MKLTPELLLAIDSCSNCFEFFFGVIVLANQHNYFESTIQRLHECMHVLFLWVLILDLDISILDKIMKVLMKVTFPGDLWPHNKRMTLVQLSVNNCDQDIQNLKIYNLKNIIRFSSPSGSPRQQCGESVSTSRWRSWNWRRRHHLRERDHPRVLQAVPLCLYQYKQSHLHRIPNGSNNFFQTCM